MSVASYVTEIMKDLVYPLELFQLVITVSLRRQRCASTCQNLRLFEEEKMQEINDLFLSMLKKMLHVNCYIDFEGDILASPEDDFPSSQRLLQFEIVLHSSEVETGHDFDIGRWFSHSMCITGLHFDPVHHVPDGGVKNGIINYPAQIKDGIGERIFFKALGERTLTLQMATGRESSNEDFDTEYTGEGVEIESVSINFDNVSLSEQKDMLKALELESARLNELLAQCKDNRSYKILHDLTELNSRHFNKPKIPS